ncbi:MAG: hypothetical protein L3J05_01515 [Robiginitomaculum sp.]|nr:hypothetical protein [Robiginitomaculum sp.]
MIKKIGAEKKAKLDAKNAPKGDEGEALKPVADAPVNEPEAPKVEHTLESLFKPSTPES